MNYAKIKLIKIMKNISTLAVCALFSIVGLSSCTPDRNSQQATVQPAKIDYSNCPYVGLSGSTYERTAGSGDTYMVMMFWFDPDGTGAWGYNKSGIVEVFAFHYVLSGQVNVTFMEDKSREGSSGYFSTFSDVGQGFVSEGIVFYRVK